MGNHRVPGVVLVEIRFKWQCQSSNYNVNVASIRFLLFGVRRNPPGIEPPTLQNSCVLLKLGLQLVSTKWHEVATQWGSTISVVGDLGESKIAPQLDMHHLFLLVLFPDKEHNYSVHGYWYMLDGLNSYTKHKSKVHLHIIGNC